MNNLAKTSGYIISTMTVQLFSGFLSPEKMSRSLLTFLPIQPLPLFSSIGVSTFESLIWFQLAGRKCDECLYIFLNLIQGGFPYASADQMFLHKLLDRQ